MVRRTSLNLDFELVEQARSVLGTNGTTETVHKALAEVVRQQRLRELADERFPDLTPEALEDLRRWRA